MDISTLFSGANPLVPKFAKANVAQSQTDSSVITAVSGKKLVVICFTVMTGGTATDITFNSKGSGAGTAISMKYACGANGGAVPGYCPVGHFQTNAGEALTVTTGAGSTTGVQVTYVEV